MFSPFSQRAASAHVGVIYIRATISAAFTRQDSLSVVVRYDPFDTYSKDDYCKIGNLTNKPECARQKTARTGHSRVLHPGSAINDERNLGPSESWAHAVPVRPITRQIQNIHDGLVHSWLRARVRARCHAGSVLPQRGDVSGGAGREDQAGPGPLQVLVAEPFERKVGSKLTRG